MIQPEDFEPIREEIERALQDLFDSALAARNAADEVLDKRQKLAMRLTQIQIEITKAAIKNQS